MKKHYQFLMSVVPTIFLIITSWYVIAITLLTLPLIMQLINHQPHWSYQFLPLWHLLAGLTIGISIAYVGIKRLHSGGNRSEELLR